MSNREISGIQVKVLDMQPAIEKAAIDLADSLKGRGFSKLKHMGMVGYVETKKGIFMIDEEGIISVKALTDTNRWPVDLYPCADLEGKSVMTAVPIAVMNISPELLKGIPVKETVPLENFVRSFGRRLETNYAMCLNHLRKMMK